MAFASVSLLADQDHRRVKVVRDFDGVIHIIAWLGGSDAAYYRSLDNGRSLQLVVAATGIGLEYNFFDPLIDAQNRFWLCVQRTNALDQPQLFLWDAATTSFVKTAEFTTVATTLNVFAVDTSRKPPGTAGLNRIASLHSNSNVIKYADLENPGVGITVKTSANPQYEPRIAVSPVGNMFAAWWEDTVTIAYVAQRIETFPATFGPKVPFSAPGHVVTSLEDLKIQPGNDLPAILYRRSNGGVDELWLSELLPTGVVFTHTQVWDGVNNPTFYNQRARLSYDSRGSVHVAAYNDVPGGTPGVGEPYLWTLLRALNATTWTATIMSGGSSGGTPNMDPAVLPGRGIEQSTMRPNEFTQGFFGFFWIWPPGAPSNELDLYYVNPDEWPGIGPYPTAPGAVYGEPVFPAGPDVDFATLDSVVLDDEGTATETWPFPLEVEYDDEPAPVVIEHTMIVGYVNSLPKFTSYRRRGRIISTVTLAELTTAFDFIKARVKDLAPFFGEDSAGTTREYYFIGNEVRPTKPGHNAYRLSIPVLEVT